MKKTIKSFSAVIIALAAAACSSPDKMAEMAENLTVGCEPAVLEDAFTLNIDLAQAGVGGTDTWSRRARPYDPYRLMEKEYSYGFWIIPLK